MSVEDRKKERIKNIIDNILKNNPITGPSVRISKLLRGKLTKEKELDLNQLIKDLKSEEKLSKGDRGAAEKMPKKDFERSVFISKIKKRMKKAIPASKEYKGLRASNDKKFMGHTGRG
tara:strand:- start:269 stop:622 length:354 start_codon:yes stop_codon:yes gene_type:complete